VKTSFGREDKGRHICGLIRSCAVRQLDIKTVFYQGDFAISNIFIIMLVVQHVTRQHKRTKGLLLDAFLRAQSVTNAFGSARTRWERLIAPQDPLAAIGGEARLLREERDGEGSGRREGIASSLFNFWLRA